MLNAYSVRHSSNTFHLFKSHNVSHSLSTSPQHIIKPHRFSSSTSSSQLIDLFDHTLQQATTPYHVNQLHAQVILTSAHHSAFLSSRLVSAYSHFGRIDYAQRVFDTAPKECLSNLLLWNSVLRANLRDGCYGKLVNLYFGMRKICVFPDGFTLPLVVRGFAFLGRPRLCEILHTHVVVLGYGSHLPVVNELLFMYGRIGIMERALQLFDRMGVKNLVCWNMMVSSFALNYDCDGAVEIFRRMESGGLEPNVVTWTSLLSSHSRRGLHEETFKLFGVMLMRGVRVNAEVLAVVLSVCAHVSEFQWGVVVHGIVIKGGFEDYLHVKNALICAYGKCKDVQNAYRLFLEIETKNIVTWNSLITSYAEAGLCNEAFAVFSQLGKSDVCKTMEPNLISWSAVISAFASHGFGEESLNLFRQMLLANVMPNSVTISSILSVCADLTALNLGREVHGHVIRFFTDGNILVGNGLVNMYTKCGCLREGNLVFQKIDPKDLITWNSMITGYGMHGYGKDALKTYDEMKTAGVMPDAVTFVAILSACSHAGFVVEGRILFNEMISKFKMKPQMEHFACMVDLLGRAGSLQEATDLIKSMPLEPNICVWSALLNSCRMHKNTQVAEEISDQLFGLPLEMTGSYMLLSNIYAASGKWDDSANVRVSAKIKGFKKIPGQSWIQIKEKVHMFSAGSTVSFELKEIYGILEELAFQMESEGYIYRSRTLGSVDEEVELSH